MLRKESVRRGIACCKGKWILFWSRTYCFVQCFKSRFRLKLVLLIGLASVVFFDYGSIKVNGLRLVLRHIESNVCSIPIPFPLDYNNKIGEFPYGSQDRQVFLGANELRSSDSCANRHFNPEVTEEAWWKNPSRIRPSPFWDPFYAFESAKTNDCFYKWRFVNSYYDPFLDDEVYSSSSDSSTMSSTSGEVSSSNNTRSSVYSVIPRPNIPKTVANVVSKSNYEFSPELAISVGRGEVVVDGQYDERIGDFVYHKDSLMAQEMRWKQIYGTDSHGANNFPWSREYNCRTPIEPKCSAACLKTQPKDGSSQAAKVPLIFQEYCPHILIDIYRKTFPEYTVAFTCRQPSLLCHHLKEYHGDKKPLKPFPIYANSTRSLLASVDSSDSSSSSWLTSVDGTDSSSRSLLTSADGSDSSPRSTSEEGGSFRSAPQEDGSVVRLLSASEVQTQFDNFTNTSDTIYESFVNNSIQVDSDSSYIYSGSSSNEMDSGVIVGYHPLTTDALFGCVASERTDRRLTTVTNINTTGVVSMEAMFSYQKYVNRFPTTLEDGFDTSDVTNMAALFRGASLLPRAMNHIENRSKTIPVSSVESVSKKESLATSWVGSRIDVSDWDMRKVGTIKEMLHGVDQDARGYYVFKDDNDFSSKSALGILDTSKWVTSSLTDMQNSFSDCGILPDVSNFDVQKVTSLSQTFRRNRINFPPLVGMWNTSSVEDMTQTFYEMLWMPQKDFNLKFKNPWASSYGDSIDEIRQAGDQVLGHELGYPATANWDLRNTQTITEMFGYNQNANPATGEWNTWKLRHMDGVFNMCTSCEPEVGGWDTSQVRHMQSAFRFARRSKPDVGKWVVNKVVEMQKLFAGAQYVPDVSRWKTTNLQDMGGIFESLVIRDRVWNNHQNDTNHILPNVRNWDVSKVVSMKGAFSNIEYDFMKLLPSEKFAENGSEHLEATIRSWPDVSLWDTISCTEMTLMFYNCRFCNPDVGNWQVQNVKSFFGMFRNTIISNPDTSKWQLKAATDLSGMFSYAYSANPSVSEWDVAQVVVMNELFLNARAANPDVSKWVVSKVQSMDLMFASLANGEPQPITTSNKWFTSEFLTSNTSKEIDAFYGVPNLAFREDDYSAKCEIESDRTRCGALFPTENSYLEYRDERRLAISRAKSNRLVAIDRIIFPFYEGAMRNNFLGNVFSRGYYSHSESGEAISILDPDVFRWNTTSLTTMTGLFHYAVNARKVDVSNWCVHKVENLDFAFYYAYKAKEIDVSKWKLPEKLFENAHARDPITPRFQQMFYYAAVNGSIAFPQRNLAFQSLELSPTTRPLQPLPSLIFPNEYGTSMGYAPLDYAKLTKQQRPVLSFATTTEEPPIPRTSLYRWAPKCLEDNHPANYHKRFGVDPRTGKQRDWIAGGWTLRAFIQNADSAEKFQPRASSLFVTSLVALMLQDILGQRVILWDHGRNFYQPSMLHYTLDPHYDLHESEVCSRCDEFNYSPQDSLKQSKMVNLPTRPFANEYYGYSAEDNGYYEGLFPPFDKLYCRSCEERYDEKQMFPLRTTVANGNDEIPNFPSSAAVYGDLELEVGNRNRRGNWYDEDWYQRYVTEENLVLDAGATGYASHRQIGAWIPPDIELKLYRDISKAHDGIGYHASVDYKVGIQMSVSESVSSPYEIGSEYLNVNLLGHPDFVKHLPRVGDVNPVVDRTSEEFSPCVFIQEDLFQFPAAGLDASSTKSIISSSSGLAAEQRVAWISAISDNSFQNLSTRNGHNNSTRSSIMDGQEPLLIPDTSWMVYCNGRKRLIPPTCYNDQWDTETILQHEAQDGVRGDPSERSLNFFRDQVDLINSTKCGVIFQGENPSEEGGWLASLVVLLELPLIVEFGFWTQAVIDKSLKTLLTFQVELVPLSEDDELLAFFDPLNSPMWNNPVQVNIQGAADYSLQLQDFKDWYELIYELLTRAPKKWLQPKDISQIIVFNTLSQSPLSTRYPDLYRVINLPYFSESTTSDTTAGRASGIISAQNAGGDHGDGIITYGDDSYGDATYGGPGCNANGVMSNSWNKNDFRFQGPVCAQEVKPVRIFLSRRLRYRSPAVWYFLTRFRITEKEISAAMRVSMSRVSTEKMFYIPLYTDHLYRPADQGQFDVMLRRSMGDTGDGFTTPDSYSNQFEFPLKWSSKQPYVSDSLVCNYLKDYVLMGNIDTFGLPPHFLQILQNMSRRLSDEQSSRRLSSWKVSHRKRSYYRTKSRSQSKARSFENQGQNFESEDLGFSNVFEDEDIGNELRDLTQRNAMGQNGYDRNLQMGGPGSGMSPEEARAQLAEGHLQNLFPLCHGDSVDPVSLECIPTCRNMEICTNTLCTECEACPVGKQPTPNRYACETICQPGSYLDRSSNACIPAPLGHEVTKAGMDHYTKCREGFIADTIGTAKCEFCAAGTVSNTARTQCEMCPGGTFNSNAAASSNCRQCDRGSFSAPGAAVCSPCPIGSYQPKKSQDQCIPCPPFATTYLSGATHHRQCQCAAGYYNDCLPNGGELTTMAELMGRCGVYNNDHNGSSGSSSGSTADIVAHDSLNCKSCPSGGFCGGYAILLKTTTSSSSSESVVDVLNWNQADLCQAADICKIKNADSSALCIHRPPVAKIGFWSTSTKMYEVLDCFSNDLSNNRCPGGKPDACSFSSLHEGSFGIACAECKPGYFWGNKNRCEKCGAASGIFAFSSTLVVFLFVTIAMWYQSCVFLPTDQGLFTAEEVFARVLVLKATAPIGLLLGHLQSFWLIQEIGIQASKDSNSYQSGDNSDGLFSLMGDPWKVIRNFFLGFFSVQCFYRDIDTHASFLVEHVVRNMIPLILFLCLLVNNFVATQLQVVGKKIPFFRITEEYIPHYRYGLAVIFAFLETFFITISGNALSVVRSSRSGQQLQDQPSILTSSDTYQTLLSVSVVATFVWCGGYLICAWLMFGGLAWMIENRFFVKFFSTEVVQQRIAILLLPHLARFEDSYAYFGLFLIVRNLSLVLCLFIARERLCIAAFALIFLFSIILNLRCRPYRFARLFKVDTLVLTVQIVICVLVVMLWRTKDSSGELLNPSGIDSLNNSDTSGNVVLNANNDECDSGSLRGANNLLDPTAASMISNSSSRLLSFDMLSSNDRRKNHKQSDFLSMETALRVLQFGLHDFWRGFDRWLSRVRTLIDGVEETSALEGPSGDIVAIAAANDVRNRFLQDSQNSIVQKDEEDRWNDVIRILALVVIGIYIYVCIQIVSTIRQYLRIRKIVYNRLYKRLKPGSTAQSVDRRSNPAEVMMKSLQKIASPSDSVTNTQLQGKRSAQQRQSSILERQASVLYNLVDSRNESFAGTFSEDAQHVLYTRISDPKLVFSLKELIKMANYWNTVKDVSLETTCRKIVGRSLRIVAQVTSAAVSRATSRSGSPFSSSTGLRSRTTLKQGQGISGSRSISQNKSKPAKTSSEELRSQLEEEGIFGKSDSTPTISGSVRGSRFLSATNSFGVAHSTGSRTQTPFNTPRMQRETGMKLKDALVVSQRLGLYSKKEAIKTRQNVKESAKGVAELRHASSNDENAIEQDRDHKNSIEQANDNKNAFKQANDEEELPEIPEPDGSQENEIRISSSEDFAFSASDFQRLNLQDDILEKRASLVYMCMSDYTMLCFQRLMIFIDTGNRELPGGRENSQPSHTNKKEMASGSDASAVQSGVGEIAQSGSVGGPMNSASPSLIGKSVENGVLREIKTDSSEKTSIQPANNETAKTWLQAMKSILIPSNRSRRSMFTITPSNATPALKANTGRRGSTLYASRRLSAVSRAAFLSGKSMTAQVLGAGLGSDNEIEDKIGAVAKKTFRRHCCNRLWESDISLFRLVRVSHEQVHAARKRTSDSR